MRILICLAAWMILLNPLWAQMNLSGLVIDESNQPVVGASAFLNNTSYVTLTDSIGGFSLSGISANHQLIVYKAGYELKVMEVNRSGKLQVRLTPSAEGQTVDTTNYSVLESLEREEFLATFKLDFLGQSRNAENCEILNPQVISFDLNREQLTLKASASAPILIRNKRLGYDLTYYLDAYERNTKVSSYLGYVSYQNTPGLELKPKHFEARLKAYQGSTVHFLKSVLAGRHNREGYRLQTATLVGNDWLWKEIPISDLAVYNDQGVFLFGAGKFRIIYLAERREYNYVRFLKANGIKEIGRGQYSGMEFAEQKVKILPSGTLEPALGLVFRGYMGWEKMADALPMNYKP